jgi:voltage-gated potassium channel
MTSIRERLYQTIFLNNTKASRLFDMILIWIILISVVVVIMESVLELQDSYYNLFISYEWTVTIIFTIEYILRIYAHPKPFKYIFSFWGLIDLLALLPNYISLIFAGTNLLFPIRILRLFRVLRIFKLGRYLKEANVLLHAISRSFYKISVFLMSLVFLVVIMGSIMYFVEDGKGGFDSIPKSIYWAIITVTTVGYGDIVPLTALGKFIASFMMIAGYSILAVPTGILTAELSSGAKQKNAGICPRCKKQIMVKDANYCYVCGMDLEKNESRQDVLN